MSFSSKDSLEWLFGNVDLFRNKIIKVNLIVQLCKCKIFMKCGCGFTEIIEYWFRRNQTNRNICCGHGHDHGLSIVKHGKPCGKS